MFKLNSGVVGSKLPVNRLRVYITKQIPGHKFSRQLVKRRKPTAQALSGKDADHDFRNIEPASMLGRMVHL